MVGVRRSIVPVSDESYIRKIRKPMIEKQRRDRMNRSIDTLKMLIADSISESCPGGAKLDKAEVLDLTVSHLQRLKNQQSSVAMATQLAAYSSGFKDCARETIHFLSSTGVINPDSLGHLNHHLQSVFQNPCAATDVNRVSMTTEDIRPCTASSPDLQTIQPQFYSTPVQTSTCTSRDIACAQRTKLPGISQFLRSGHSFTDSSPDSVADSGLEDSSCNQSVSRCDSAPDRSSDSSFDSASGGYDSACDSAYGSTSGYDSGHGEIIQEEQPWRPW